MRRALFVLAIAGCGFKHGLLDGVSDAPLDDSVIDSANDDAPDPLADARADATNRPYCDTQDPDLVACYRFESNMNDSSGHNLNATNTNVSYPTGKVGKALLSAANSNTDVTDSTLWDVPAFTVEAWIKPSQLPTTGNRMGIVDVDGEWGFFLQESGQLACTVIGGVSSGLVTANVAVDVWSHVACTYDGMTTTVYKDGGIVFKGGGGGAISLTSTGGLSIAANGPGPNGGARLIGLIDEVRLMSRARTELEICDDAACP